MSNTERFPFITGIAKEVMRRTGQGEFLNEVFSDLCTQIDREIKRIRMAGHFTTDRPSGSAVIAFTKREKEVIPYLLQGARTNDIAKDIGVKGNTISTVIAVIYDRLNLNGALRNRIELKRLVDLYGIEGIPDPHAPEAVRARVKF